MIVTRGLGPAPLLMNTSGLGPMRVLVVATLPLIIKMDPADLIGGIAYFDDVTGECLWLSVLKEAA